MNGKQGCTSFCKLVVIRLGMTSSHVRFTPIVETSPMMPADHDYREEALLTIGLGSGPGLGCRRITLDDIAWGAWCDHFFLIQ